MKKQYSDERLELESFDEEDYYKLKKSWSKKPTGPRCKPNWKRLYLDHLHDYEAHDEFFC